MRDKESAQTLPLTRRSVFVGLVICPALVVVALWYLTVGSDGGGQTAQSPSGEHLIVLMRKREHSSTEPYHITLKNYSTGQNLREFSMQPVNGSPNQVLRGGPRVIRWDDSSQFADLVFDGQSYCRIYAPSAKYQPQKTGTTEHDDDAEQTTGNKADIKTGTEPLPRVDPQSG